MLTIRVHSLSTSLLESGFEREKQINWEEGVGVFPELMGFALSHGFFRKQAAMAMKRPRTFWRVRQPSLTLVHAVCVCVCVTLVQAVCVCVCMCETQSVCLSVWERESVSACARVYTNACCISDARSCPRFPQQGHAIHPSSHMQSFPPPTLPTELGFSE